MLSGFDKSAYQSKASDMKNSKRSDAGLGHTFRLHLQQFCQFILGVPASRFGVQYSQVALLVLYAGPDLAMTPSACLI